MNQYNWEDLKLGLKHEFHASVTDEMMDHFIHDFGDSNPLHVDTGYAKVHGFRARVVYGLLSSSFYSTLVGVHLPGQKCLLHGIDVTFVKPVFVGDELTISGEINYLNEAYKQAHIRAQITSGQGVLVSKARLKIGVLS